MNKYLAEFIGTAILVVFAVGSACFGLPSIGVLGVALAFGLVLLGLAFTIGPISGCHVNPAVTLDMLLARRITPNDAAAYVVAQVLGGILGAALIKLLSSVGTATMHVSGANSFGAAAGAGINGSGAFLLEIILTFLLVLAVLRVTRGTDNHIYAGIAIGLTLTAIHLVGIPLDGTSVNPARSIGPALFSGGTALSQLWLFIAAPLIGAVLAATTDRALTTSTPAPTPATAVT